MVVEFSFSIIFYDFGHERKIRNKTIIREPVLIKIVLKERRY